LGISVFRVIGEIEYKLSGAAGGVARRAHIPTTGPPRCLAEVGMQVQAEEMCTAHRRRPATKNRKARPSGWAFLFLE
jgi:hypothetical protein